MTDPRGRVRDPARRDRILDAATELIAQHGYLGVNLADIGTAAGIVGSGIYRHFDSKAAILVELFDRVVDRLVTDAEATLRTVSEPRQTLAALVRAHVAFTMDERDLCQIYLRESRNLPDGDHRRLRWKQRHYLDLWHDVLCAVRPELDPAHAQVRVHAAISCIHSILRYRSPLPYEELADQLTEAACRALGITVTAAADQPDTATAAS
ncbi:TetR/AcrR family transcriptional regulator [Acrocarpospora catenulata]|uniref:TetR/AcrR family transcriptional regulator n=1 Tax=Acrocarpospora catenulata TaxID=2836182 RepID=UPI001BDA3E0D|nr:TetR/AcrR family transcriptional regulator [Acrocarpospora catenulata]